MQASNVKRLNVVADQALAVSQEAIATRERIEGKGDLPNALALEVLGGFAKVLTLISASVAVVLESEVGE